MKTKLEQLREEAESLVAELGVTHINPTINPNKKVTQEEALEDLIAILKAMKNGEGMTEIYSTENNEPYVDPILFEDGTFKDMDDYHETNEKILNILKEYKSKNK